MLQTDILKHFICLVTLRKGIIMKVNRRAKKFRFLLMTIWTLSLGMICYNLFRFELKSKIRERVRNGFHNPVSFKPTKANFTHRELKRIPGFGNDIQLFSAIVGNSTNSSSWDRIFINGWDLKKKRKHMQFCCISYSTGFVKSFPVLYNQLTFETGVEFACKISDGGDARKASVSKTDNCHSNLSQYVSVEYPITHSEEIAIFAKRGIDVTQTLIKKMPIVYKYAQTDAKQLKVMYGNVSAVNLIMWFEVNNLLGVNKVYMYPYDDLNRSTVKVMHYYIYNGLLEVIPYTTPIKERRGTRGYFDTGLGFASANKQSSLYDGFARLKGYKYVMCFDPDEYIIPKKEKSYMEFFNRKFKEHQDAAGFYFQTYLYIKDWGATNMNASFDIGRYQKRTEFTRDCVKHVFIPGRLRSDAGFQVHELFVDKGYKDYYLPEEEAAIHHYRKCRREFLTPKTKFPCYKVKRYFDDTMVYYLKKVQDRVFEIAAQLEI